MASRYLINISTGLLMLAALFFLAQQFLASPKVFERTDYLSPPIEIKNLSAGFSTQMSDSFWLRAIQDFDFCDQKKNKDECIENSWLFNVINLTVELDTKFKEAYYFGGLALTILISDYKGASIILDKGVAIFKQDWTLLYLAAYHALYEEKDKIKASRLYFSASEHGAPAWVKLMAGRLASEGGDNIRAKEILNQLIENETDPRWIKKLKNKIERMDKAQ